MYNEETVKKKTNKNVLIGCLGLIVVIIVVLVILTVMFPSSSGWDRDKISIKDTEKEFGYNYHEAYTYAYRYNWQLAVKYKDSYWTKFYVESWDKYAWNKSEAKLTEDRFFEIMEKADMDFMAKF